MKKMTIYKSALTFFTLVSFALFSGCTGNSTNSEKGNEKNNLKSCRHLTITFADEPITFKECEGYDIRGLVYKTGGNIMYTIVKDNKIILENGVTTQANYYEVYHDVADELFDNKSIQKVK